MSKLFYTWLIYMSIVALKRNSRRFQAPISGRGNTGFSLQGGRRSQGWVGQGVRGRSLTGTSFRGLTARGAGGTYGKYPQIINNKGACCTNDPHIIKRSTMNTAGHIDSVVTYPTSIFNASCENGACPPPEWVKDFKELNHSQSSHIAKVARKSGSCHCNDDEAHDAGYDHCSKDCKSAAYHIGGKKYVRERYAKELNYLHNGGEMYQRTGLMRKNKLPTPDTLKAWPVALNHNDTCMVNAMTPEQGKKMGLLPNKWMEHRTASVNALQRQQQLPEMLVGSGYGDIPDISNSVRREPSGILFADKQNVSWMLKLDDDHLLINNELGMYDGNDNVDPLMNKIVSNSVNKNNLGDLFIIDNSGNQTERYNLTTKKGLGGPVYFCKYENQIFVACYGSWEDPNAAGIFVFAKSNDKYEMKNGQGYKSIFTSKTGNSAIHMIDKFIYTNNQSKAQTFLLAVDILAKCIYKIDPTAKTILFDTIVYDFNNLFPRHFVQIPNTNYIALITERGDPAAKGGNNKKQTLVIILEYDGSMFQNIHEIDLGDEFVDKKNILKGITGAEIKYVKHSIYVTIRGYTEPYQDYQTKPENGLFVKLNVDEKTGVLSLNSYIEVGKDPRYFAVQDNIAYVANHLGKLKYDPKNPKPGDISIIKLPHNKDTKLSKDDEQVVSPGNIYPVFILLQ